MAYPGLTTFIVMLGVAVGSALFFYLNSENPTTYGSYDGRSNNSGNNYSSRPATSSKIASSKLPRRRKQKCEECVICLSDLSNGVKKILNCSHTFHELCINKWLRNSTTCPVCRELVQ